MKKTNYIVKKYVLCSILVVLGMLSTSISAKAGQYYKPVKQRIGIWTDLGLNTWLMKNTEIKNSFGGGVGLGFGYELQRDHFLFHIGFGANAIYNPVKVNNVDIVLYGQDDWDPLYRDRLGEKVDYYYSQTERVDKYVNLNLQVPVMIGFTKDRFFMLAGAKFGYMLNLQTFCDATMDTKGYNATIGWMQDMPMYQYYTGRTKSQTMRCSFKPDVAVSIEMGGYLGQMIKGTGYNRFRKSKHCRLSVFADYGLLSINSPSSVSPIITPSQYVAPSTYDMVEATSLKDVVSSNVAGKLNNLFVGIKFMALFDLPEPGKCVLCNSETRFVPRHSQSGTRKPQK